MVEFETLKAEEVKFGNNNFIEVARKKAIAPEGENEFIAISRGFFAPDGSKRFKKSFTVPDSPEVVNFICEKLLEMSAGGSAAEATEKAPAEEAAPEETSEKEAPAEEENTGESKEE